MWDQVSHPLRRKQKVTAAEVVMCEQHLMSIKPRLLNLGKKEERYSGN